MSKSITFLSQSKKWALKNELKGPNAFTRYVMFRFVENLNQVSSDFVLKGGNLLWAYIHTPRTTIDLDFVTLKSDSDKTVRNVLEQAGLKSFDILYTIKSFKSVSESGKFGAAIVLEYKTDAGAMNQFDLDIVYALATDTTQIDSPINERQMILSASIENIIVDKVSACAQFGSGNTRMKDYDDLFRLRKSGVQIDYKKIKQLFSERKVKRQLDPNWIDDDLKRSWASYRKQYLDLPENLVLLFEEVNELLK